MITKQLEHYIKCFDEEKYFQAHEALESVWFPRRFEDNDEIRLLKGFINAAVSFELLKRGRKTQSKRVWKNYLKYKQLLHKIDSPYIKKYHKLAKHIESKMIDFIY